MATEEEMQKAAEEHDLKIAQDMVHFTLEELRDRNCPANTLVDIVQAVLAEIQRKTCWVDERFETIKGPLSKFILNYLNSLSEQKPAPSTVATVHPTKPSAFSSYLEKNLQRLKGAITEGKLDRPESWLSEYTSQMQTLGKDCDILPPRPSLKELSIGGVFEACKAVGIPPPKHPTEHIDARKRLEKISLEQRIDLVLYMCTAAYNDLQWLRAMGGVHGGVHGAGSVVRDGWGTTHVVVRPRVVRDMEGNKTVSYETVAGGSIPEDRLPGLLVHTEWQFGAFLSPSKELGLTRELLTMSPSALYSMADRWGVKCRGCSDERCREMMVDKAIELRTTSFVESVNKAWKKERPEIVISLMPRAGSESTAQIETAARGKLKKPAETAPTAEWVAWEAQQKAAKSERKKRPRAQRDK